MSVILTKFNKWKFQTKKKNYIKIPPSERVRTTIQTPRRLQFLFKKKLNKTLFSDSDKKHSHHNIQLYRLQNAIIIVPNTH